ncbi:MAG TPA: acyl-CoA dehydrogenase family protein [Ktedonobacteraceae bacterium]|nr:acyl-CoA dehydrogenase family protein [Ktedonobacteraceae bacterium]
MPNFALTEEQEEVRRLAQSIAVEQLRANARRSEKNGDISPELMQTLAQTGLTTPFPELYGGSGPIEAMTYALIAEELGFGDGSLAMNVLGSMMGPLTVALAGDENQQKQYIPPFCDEREGYMQRGSLAFAERTGGYSLVDVSATVCSEGQGLVLNGTKRDVIHGKQANPRVALFRREGATGTGGLCAIVLPERGDGMEIHEDAQKLGLIAAPSASYTFTDAVVPTNCLLGDGEGVVRAATLYAIIRAGVACGMARAALEYAGEYAKGRIAFGRPIVSYQGIAFMIAEMAMKLDAARLLLWHAATSWDRGAECETLIREAEAAQHQAIKMAKSATTDGVQILGGAGFLQDHPVEMWMRNAAAME